MPSLQKKAVGRPRLNTSVVDFDISFSPKRRRQAPDLPEIVPDVRYDNYEHWPQHRGDRPRCCLCKEKNRVGCTKCQKRLCFTKDKNCFVDFHKNDVDILS